jgi:hypothetical protein
MAGNAGVILTKMVEIGKQKRPFTRLQNAYEVSCKHLYLLELAFLIM